MLAAHWACAQDSELLSAIVESPLDGELTDPDWIDYLWELREHPLNINKASLEELLRIPFIDAHLAKQLLRYRSEVGEISRIDELLKLEGVSEELIDALQPLVTCKPVARSSRLIYRIRSRLELPNRVGYQKQVYQNPLYLQQRILFQTTTGRISGGILWEKDPGESNIFDYGSIFLQYRHPEQKYVLLLGDFHQQYGAGLILWSPYGIPFSIHSLPMIKEYDSQAIGNKSATENSFLRGFSLFYQVRPGTEINFFYSANPLDGNLSDNNRYFSSLYNSGLHRTKKEISTRGNIKEKMAGISFTTRLRTLQLQFCSLTDRFNPNHEKFPGNLYYQSMAYSLTTKSFQPAGELAFFQFKYPAFQQNFYYRTERLKYEVVWYYYHPRYFTVHGHALGSLSTLPQNRSGVAMILNHKVGSRLRIGGYLHYYRDLIAGEDIFGIKRDLYLELSYRLSDQIIRLRFQQNYRPPEIPDLILQEKRRQILRLDHTCEIASGFEVKNMIQLSWAQPLIPAHHYHGASLLHQISWNRNNIKISAGWSSFDIPDYELRLYESEPDLSGTTRSILLNERGNKFYLLSQIRIRNKFQLDLKYGQRYYPDLINIGTGLDSYPANRIHELKISVIGKM
jgi:hypothetical protein